MWPTFVSVRSCKLVLSSFRRNSASHIIGTLGTRWQPTAFCVLGLGKLGGQELNYSSDVDLMYIYEDEGDVFKELPTGKTPPRAAMSNHQYFCKLAETLSDEISRATADGFLYRVDLRLRPEGDRGPIARSLESCENYYAQWGQNWERLMLIKTRHVAGDGSLASEFLEMIQPFRFPGSISHEILQEIAATKTRLEKEVVREGELERNVKLGRGGIREIEFTVQALQVLHAGRSPFLQIPQTLPCLEKLAQYDLLATKDASQLRVAYGFLRDVEHRLQMENNLQTHTLPEDKSSLLRLARLMNFATLPKFQSALRLHSGNVRRVYESLFGKETPASVSASLPSFDGAGEQWIRLLAARSFREPEKAAQLFKEFAEGPGYQHVSSRTTELARLLIPKFLALCPPSPPTGKPQAVVLSDPDRVLARMDSFIGAYGSRASLFELWNNNLKFFELILLLFDRSEFLAEAAIRTPDLIDSLVATGQIQRRKSADEILKELRFGLKDADQFLWLRRYHQAELMRLGLRDISGQVDIEQTPADFSAFADACLRYALEVILRKNKNQVITTRCYWPGKTRRRRNRLRFRPGSFSLWRDRKKRNCRPFKKSRQKSWICCRAGQNRESSSRPMRACVRMGKKECWFPLWMPVKTTIANAPNSGRFRRSLGRGL